MISAKDIDTLRSIARAGDDYGTIKRLLDMTEWEIDEDDTKKASTSLSGYSQLAPP
ncbi:hypothetical protein SBV1_2740004 [Verrucomicrobia bacterium]|nr:hypothetical protein SBV1_2740004 [Verrucomicrobiota bacterium]